jgi:hypothetical protein
MSTSAQFPAATMTPELLGQVNEQLLDANRAAAEMFLDMYETTLESIASYQEQAANQTNVDWIATAARAQATFTRELAKHQVSMGRELLRWSHEIPAP